MAVEFPLQNQNMSASNELDELRDLLVGPERAELAAIKSRMDDPKLRAVDLSMALPEAIARRSAMDKQLNKALNPILEEGVRNYIKKYPHSISKAIVPVVGSTLREAFLLGVKNKLDAVNQFLIRNVSLKGLKWRWESFRAKKTFDEIMLLHTLLYRVEQVFIIHREKGTVLQHVSEIKEEVIDEANMFSDTLKLIQSSNALEHEDTNNLKVGEYTVWVEQGNHLMIAGVIRGTPPFELRRVFKETLQTIEDEHQLVLEKFDGNAEPFQSTRHLLQTCLRVEYGKKKASYLPIWITGILILCILLGWSSWVIYNNSKWNGFIERLNNEQGIMIASEGKSFGKYYITGMRDPLAVDPDILLKEMHINSSRVSSKWETYYALNPDIILKRARYILKAPQTVTLQYSDGVLIVSGIASTKWIIQAKSLYEKIQGITSFQEQDLFDYNSTELFLARVGVQLEPPSTVSMHLENETLKLIGTAPHQWIVSMRSKATTIPGIVRLDDSELTDMDISELSILQSKIEKHIILFRVGTSDLVPGQEKTIQALIDDLQNLNSVIQTVGKGHVEIVGHTDRTGTEQSNLKLSQERAEIVLNLLKSNNLDTRHLTAIGVGAKEPLRSENTVLDREFNRSVTFKLLIY